MKKYYLFLFNMFFLILNIDSFCQTTLNKDSFQILAYTISSNVTTQQNPINGTIYYYNNDRNVQILKKNNKFIRREFYQTGEIFSESEVDVFLLEDSYFNGRTPDNDTTSFRITRYKISLQKKGNYIEWYKNGKIKVRGYYWWEDKHKTWKYYDENGNFIKKIKWIYDLEAK